MPFKTCRTLPYGFVNGNINEGRRRLTPAGPFFPCAIRAEHRSDLLISAAGTGPFRNHTAGPQRRLAPDAVTIGARPVI